MIDIKKDPGRNIIFTKVSEKLKQEDYDRMLPVAEEVIEKHGDIRWLLELENFEGLTPDALWEEVKFDAQHLNDVEKIAVVGKKDWMDWGTQLMKPFTSGETRFFPYEEREAARTWIRK